MSIDADVVSSWAAPGIFVGVLLAALGVGLHLAARQEGWESLAFVFVSFLAAGVVAVFAIVALPAAARGESPPWWGSVIAGSICASPGIGTLLAGAIWMGARALKRPPKPPADLPPREL